MASRHFARPRVVLFLDRDNGPRSLIAEAVLSAQGGGAFVAHSAGIEPAATDPSEVKAVLARHGIPRDDLQSKSWTEFARPDSPALDFVIVTDDRSVAALRPIWNGHPTRIVWEIPSPAEAAGECPRTRQEIETTYWLVRSCLNLFLSMPHGMLERMVVDDPHGLDIDGSALGLLARSRRTMAHA
jgi:protein-tyrosine-phosphatase